MGEQGDRSDENRDDPKVDAETEAAAAEAAAIGGPGQQTPDPADQAPAESGQGEAEGFEQAERALEKQASHKSDSGPEPRPLGEPEQRVDAEFGEADEVVPSEGRREEGSDS